MSVLAVFVIPETNPQILLQRRAKKLVKETGDDRWHAPVIINESARKHVINSLIRPMKVLFSLEHRSDDSSYSSVP